MSDMANSKPVPKQLPKTENEKKWYVVYCKPNTEKKTLEKLQKIGVEVYCPFRTELRQWSDRKKKIDVPVLPSMIMVRLQDKDRAKVFQVPTVIRYLFWLKKPAIVKEEEVQELKNILSGHTSQVLIEKISKGEALKLKGLGFDGEKVVLKYTTNSYYCVYLERLGFMVKIKK